MSEERVTAQDLRGSWLICLSKLVRYLYHYEAESRRAVGGRMEVEVKKEEKKDG